MQHFLNSLQEANLLRGSKNYNHKVTNQSEFSLHPSCYFAIILNNYLVFIDPPKTTIISIYVYYNKYNINDIINNLIYKFIKIFFKTFISFFLFSSKKFSKIIDV